MIKRLRTNCPTAGFRRKTAKSFAVINTSTRHLFIYSNAMGKGKTRTPCKYIDLRDILVQLLPIAASLR